MKTKINEPKVKILFQIEFEAEFDSNDDYIQADLREFLRKNINKVF